MFVDYSTQDADKSGHEKEVHLTKKRFLASKTSYSIVNPVYIDFAHQSMQAGASFTIDVDTL